MGFRSKAVTISLSLATQVMFAAQHAHISQLSTNHPLRPPPLHGAPDSHGARAHCCSCCCRHCCHQPPVVREVVLTIEDEGDALTVSSMKAVHIHSSSLESIPYTQRPQGPLDENGWVGDIPMAAGCCWCRGTERLMLNVHTARLHAPPHPFPKNTHALPPCMRPCPAVLQCDCCA